jgi:5-oxopent-3-ene-1,2,5-tricarboxylate decarboxylase/2-hydroxyhepta-2,4-diene-1,7-dioate isomerase
MTLSPGDVILTGTPEGVQNVMPGDDIVCRIEGLGWLKNTIVAEPGRGRPTSGGGREG